MSELDFYKDKKVFITGHTGFKGAWLCALLNYLDADVYGYALKADDVSLYNQCHMDEYVKSYIGDIRDYDHLDKVISEVNPEIVIHMAAQAIVKEGYENPRYTYDVNVMGIVNLLDCLRNSDSVRSIINVTTDKVYKVDYSRAYKEEDIINGYDPYANSKSCSELVADTYYNCFLKEKGIALSSLRAGNVIGGGDFSRYRIISDCLNAYLDNKDIIIRNPESIRPFQHVLEVLYMYLLIAKRQYEDISLSGSYNIGPDDYIDILNLVELFISTIRNKKDIDIHYVIQNDNGPYEAEKLLLDNSKIKEVFDYHVKWNTSKAVDEICNYIIAYQSNEDIKEYINTVIEEYLD